MMEPIVQWINGSISSRKVAKGEFLRKTEEKFKNMAVLSQNTAFKQLVA